MIHKQTIIYLHSGVDVCISAADLNLKISKLNNQSPLQDSHYMSQVEITVPAAD